MPSNHRHTPRRGTRTFIILLHNQDNGTFKKSKQGLEGKYTFHEVIYLDGKPELTEVKEVTIQSQPTLSASKANVPPRLASL